LISPTHFLSLVQGQAGSQAIEDAAALGTFFSNISTTDAPSISKCLESFENVRRNRASAMQLLSDTTVNHSDQEGIRKAVQPYMPGQTVPGEWLWVEEDGKMRS
jgi:salicylate hydroxylase